LVSAGWITRKIMNSGIPTNNKRSALVANPDFQVRFYPEFSVFSIIYQKLFKYNSIQSKIMSNKYYCKKCKYELSEERINMKCPYCGEADTFVKKETAQDLLDSVTDKE